MADQVNLSEKDEENTVHRRVQKHIAGRYLDEIDPSGAIVRELYKDDPEYRDRLQQFKQIDPDTKKKFDQQYRQFRRTESPYSIQNILWLIAAIAVFYYTDFYLVVRYDARINRLWFNMGAVLITINVGIGAFLIVWLSYIKRVDSDDWERKYPTLIPTATASFVLGGVFLTVGLWPIWSLFTPVLLLVLFMGLIVSVAMMPNF